MYETADIFEKQGDTLILKDSNVSYDLKHCFSLNNAILEESLANCDPNRTPPQPRVKTSEAPRRENDNDYGLGF